MYGPKARVRVHLFLVGSMILFVGALALPYLVEEDVVRVRFGGDGLRTQGGAEELVPDVNVQADLRPPRALLTTPETSADAHFSVGWDGDGPDPTGHYAFHLQYGVVDAQAEDDVAWQDWFEMRRSHLPREAVFTGDPAEVYAFRARTCDLLARCGVWSDTHTTRVAPDAVAPDVRLALDPGRPAIDQVVSGRVAIDWDYQHDGPGDAVVNVAVRPAAADGTEAVPVYSGPGRSAVWDTREQADGRYVVTLELRDGAHRVGEEIPVRVANEKAPGVEMSAPEPREGEEDPASGPDAEESPPMAPLVGLLALAVVVASRRSS